MTTLTKPVTNHQSQTPRRNLSLDLLKAFAIAMVIFYHNGQLNPDSITDNILMMIPNAAVPCFFMASGAVFFHRPFDLQKHIHRIIRFYLTVVAWKVIYLMLYWHWGAPRNGSLRELLSYLFLFQHLERVGTAHFWFMDAMLTVMLIAPILYLCFHLPDDATSANDPSRWKKLLPGHSQLLAFLLAALLLFNQLPATGNLILRILCQLIGKPEWNISPLGEVNPFSFRYSNYFTFYLLGGLLMEYKERFTVRSAAVLTLIGSTGLVCIKYLLTGMIRWNGAYLESGYYWLSTILLASGLFLLSVHWNVREHSITGWIAKYIGTYTMGIFYLHIPFIFVLTPVVFAKLQPYNSWLINLAESCLILILSIPVIWAGRKIPILKNLFR